MISRVLVALAISVIGLSGFAVQPAMADGYYAKKKKSAYRAKRARSARRSKVRGYVRRRGGYSYSPQDTINTYGDSRSLFGGVNAFRDPSTDTQTRGGPFDHGWFFDSGIGTNGGNAPYLN
ncbi:MAG: hypothetical protein AAF732_21355 [Pseudomonadota bacterium]